MSMGVNKEFPSGGLLLSNELSRQKFPETKGPELQLHERSVERLPNGATGGSAVPPELSEPQSESDSGAPHSPQHGPHKTDHSHLGGANSQVGEPSWLSDFRAMDAPYHILHRHVGCGKSRRTGSPVNNCRMGSAACLSI